MLHRKDKKSTPYEVLVLVVEHRGFEPLTPTLPVLCAPNCANAPWLTLLIIADCYGLVKGF